MSAHSAYLGLNMEQDFLCQSSLHGQFAILLEHPQFVGTLMTAPSEHPLKIDDHGVSSENLIRRLSNRYFLDFGRSGSVSNNRPGHCAAAANPNEFVCPGDQHGRAGNEC